MSTTNTCRVPKPTLTKRSRLQFPIWSWNLRQILCGIKAWFFFCNTSSTLHYSCHPSPNALHSRSRILGFSWYKWSKIGFTWDPEPDSGKSLSQSSGRKLCTLSQSWGKELGVPIKLLAELAKSYRIDKKFLFSKCKCCSFHK